jgi:Holliday junction DNA helicase RuvA
MYHHLTGSVVAHVDGCIVLEVGGVGYLIQFSSPHRPKVGDEAKIFVHQVVRENEIFLCGFVALEEKSLFLNLIKVSGVGPSMAMQILSQADIPAIVSSIVAGEIPALTKFKGVGKKTAERIVLELRDRLQVEAFAGAAAPNAKLAGLEPWPEDALLALVALGLQPDLARERLEACHKAGLVDGSVDDWVKRALSLGR